MKYLRQIFSIFTIVLIACAKKGGHCQGTVLSKYYYPVPHAKVSIETYKKSGPKIRSKVEAYTDAGGFFDVIYGYREGDVVKFNCDCDSGKISEVFQGDTRVFYLK